MPSRIALDGSPSLLRSTLLAAALSVPVALAGQEQELDLPLERDYPGDGPYVCAPVPFPSRTPEADERAQANQLASEADQSTILGDFERAQTLLARAAESNPASADLAYRHARALEDIDQLQPAMAEYCRAIAIAGPNDRIDDAGDRIDRLYELVRERIPPVAREAFVSGLAYADSALFGDAVSAFTVAVDEAPGWGAPIYNRAVIWEYLGRIQESLADYRRYLELVPEDVDPMFLRVSARIGVLEGTAAGAPSPGGAFALGLVPGMGHYYTRRPLSGTVVLAAAVGAAAAAFLVKDIKVVCLNDVAPGAPCPQGEIIEEVTERPLLAPGLGLAAAVTLVGAVEALVKARRRRAEADALVGQPVASGWRLRPPSVRARGERVDLSLLGVSFR